MNAAPRAQTSGNTLAQSFASVLVLAVFLTRYLYVAESAAMGETLWIVGLWLVALAVWTVANWKRPFAAQSFNGLDLCVLLLAGSHILSALVIIATVGEKRLAMNLAWEWFGVIIGWALLRQAVRESRFRRELVIGIIATSTAVAGLGIYQHYVDFPRTAAKYGPLFDRLKHANAAEQAAISQQLAAEGIPTSGPGVTLFEKRLRDSREPIGFFALANTLGGFLAVGLLLLGGYIVVMSKRTNPTVARILSWAIPLILLAWCLLLTKSRTAWVGTMVGTVLLLLGAWGVRLNRRRAAILAGTAGSLVVVAFVLGQVGGLDRQVLTESTKSLQYRMQYWVATWPMIKDHPWLGVGPGQFRWQYLHYKLPEASEEIADPHNLLFDVAANGGIVALIGLVGLVVITIVRTIRQNGLSSDETVSPSKSTPFDPYGRILAAIAGVAWCLLLLFGIEDRLLIVLPIVVLIMWWLRGEIEASGNRDAVLKSAVVAAWTALLVHLLGAGGIGMPAVSLLILALVAVLDAPKTETSPVSVPVKGGVPVSLVAASLVGLVGINLTAIQPHAVAQEKLRLGDEFVTRGQLERADAEYRMAAEADPFSSEPRRRRAELAYRQVESGHFRSNESFLNAVGLMREAQARDPGGFQDDRRLGEWWLAKWQVTADKRDAEESVESFRKAWRKYPTNALLMADLVSALQADAQVGEAVSVAKQALSQDALNREKQHVDRYLPDNVKRKLEQLVESTTANGS